MKDTKNPKDVRQKWNLYENMRFVDAAKCKYSLGESNKCGICKKSEAHGDLEMLTFLEEIQQFWKADKHEQKGTLQKGL